MYSNSCPTNFRVIFIGALFFFFGKNNALAQLETFQILFQTDHFTHCYDVAPTLDQGYIITSFYYPDHPNFTFEGFYSRLNDKQYVIYPGKLGQADCFRIGSIGRLFPSDIRALLAAIRETLEEMEIEL